ncbi:ABC transporter ATP-binding protein [Ferrovibrio sp.]|uniref:ABC transporter ATP-binding protein n=1 Tax=Ferrovibrio sp. TaxID=1917215 RepID=UPI003D123811
MPNADVLQLNNVTAKYGPTQVLHGISIKVREGGITTLLGANGAGKTTTLRAIFNKVSRSGEIIFAGESITGKAPSEIARLGFAHVPENRGTFTQMTTNENLELGAYMRSDKDGVARDLERMFRRFPVLKERRHQQAGTLSGGEQQMLAIARALMSNPRVLLLDEPSFGLAPLIVREIFEIMKAINAEDGTSILLIEQNAKMSLELADYGYLLEVGEISMQGTAADLRNDDAVRRSYLGN